MHEQWLMSFFLFLEYQGDGWMDEWRYYVIGVIDGETCERMFTVGYILVIPK